MSITNQMVSNIKPTDVDSPLKPATLVVGTAMNIENSGAGILELIVLGPATAGSFGV